VSRSSENIFYAHLVFQQELHIFLYSIGHDNSPVCCTHCTGNIATINYIHTSSVCDELTVLEREVRSMATACPGPVSHASTKNAVSQVSFPPSLRCICTVYNEKRPVVTRQWKSQTEAEHSKSAAVALLRMEVNYHRESLPPLKSNPLVRPCQTPSLGTIRAVADRGNYFPHLKRWKDMVLYKDAVYNPCAVLHKTKPNCTIITVNFQSATQLHFTSVEKKKEKYAFLDRRVIIPWHEVYITYTCS
jgi:hypothetical protein